MLFKKGVIPYKCWQYKHVRYAVDKVWLALFGHESLLTSNMDSDHSDTSLHYQGMAWDIRTRKNNALNKPHYSMEELFLAKQMIEDILGKEYDVVIEKTHIHIEFDPK